MRWRRNRRPAPVQATTTSTGGSRAVAPGVVRATLGSMIAVRARSAAKFRRDGVGDAGGPARAAPRGSRCRHARRVAPSWSSCADHDHARRCGRGGWRAQLGPRHVAGRGRARSVSLAAVRRRVDVLAQLGRDVGPEMKPIALVLACRARRVRRRARPHARRAAAVPAPRHALAGVSCTRCHAGIAATTECAPLPIPRRARRVTRSHTTRTRASMSRGTDALGSSPRHASTSCSITASSGPEQGRLRALPRRHREGDDICARRWRRAFVATTRAARDPRM